MKKLARLLSAIDKFLFVVVSRQTKKGYFSATSAWPEALEGRLCGESPGPNLRKSAVESSSDALRHALCALLFFGLR